MNRSRCYFLSGIFATTALGTLTAQVPNTLLHSIPAPPVGVQTRAQLGSSVAIDGAYTVVGAPWDDLLEADSGVVKVFDSTSGALLHVLSNPGPAPSDWFGHSVAISGTRIIVGAPGDDTGGYNAGSAYAYDLSSGTPTVPVTILNNPSPFTDDLFGYSVAISGTRVVVGAQLDETGAFDAGSAYVYDLSSNTPAVPLATLNNPSPDAYGNFGYSVAISGTLVVVGAPSDNTRAQAAGNAYVYDLSSPTPTVPVTALNNPAPAEQDYFGNSVAISGTRVVVGAPWDDAGEIHAGSAYVYDLGSGTPTVPVTTLHSPGPAYEDGFGISMSISGTWVIVGAGGDDTGAPNSGSAYLYDLTSRTPTVPVATLENPHPAPGDWFGGSVGISDRRVIVGAPDGLLAGAGRAYVYDLANGEPMVPLAMQDNPGPASGDSFGLSVAVSGTRIVVGAPGDDTGGYNAGSAYAYDLSNGAPTVPVATLNNPSPAASDKFGASVALSGPRVIVGAPLDDTGGINAGSAYVYDLSSAMPTVPVLTLNNPTPEPGDQFGTSVTISGTLMAVAAPYDNTGARAAGSVYVYDLSSATPAMPGATLHNPAPATQDSFGSSVAISGARVVVGVPRANFGGTAGGKAYLYDLRNLTPTVPVATLNNPSPAAYEEFGNSVAISGSRVVVAAYRDGAQGFDAGSAYVYDLNSPTPAVPVTTLNNPGPGWYGSDDFGFSVAISGARVVVGARGSDRGMADAGSAYVYDLNSATPELPVATLNNPAPAATDQFGWSVTIDGDTVAVGTPFDNSPQADKGAVYIYEPNPLDQDSDGLLDSWELTHWPTTAGHGALDDFDRDGYVELLELAFGLNPTLPDAGGLPPVTNEDGYLTMSLTKHPGVTYEIQSGGTLLAGQEDSFSAATTKVLTDTPTALKVRDTVLIGTSAARFLRVKAIGAP